MSTTVYEHSTHPQYHRNTLIEHLYRASKFLKKHQLVEPWITNSVVYSRVNPRELGKYVDAYEDFHDTLEAIASIPLIKIPLRYLQDLSYSTL